MALEPLIEANPWLAALVAAVMIAGPAARVIIFVWGIRGAEPKDRVTLIKALAELFRAWSWFRRGGGGPQ